MRRVAAHCLCQRALLLLCTRSLTNWMRDGDQVVDFSCGENVFVPMVKEQCLRWGRGWVMLGHGRGDRAALPAQTAQAPPPGPLPGWAWW